MDVVVTGGAGFIGSHLCERLLRAGHRVTAVDSFDSFYDPAIKRRNVEALVRAGEIRVVEADIRDAAAMDGALAGVGGDAVVVHLAALAGVRPSIEAPVRYADVNVTGTATVLEAARRVGIRRFVFGSSSSVYGNAPRVPFSEADPVDRPISPYAATKRAGELLCHTYAHLYGFSLACLRFFTVYGPRQRPDLAIHKFGRLIATGRPITLFGDGTTERDYTYVDDIVDGIERAIVFTGANPGAYEIFNLGGSRTVPLQRLVDLLADALQVEPRIERLPAQPGDVERTFADVAKSARMLGYVPGTRIEDGIPRFIRWLHEDLAAGASRG